MDMTLSSLDAIILLRRAQARVWFQENGVQVDVSVLLPNKKRRWIEAGSGKTLVEAVQMAAQDQGWIL